MVTQFLNYLRTQGYMYQQVSNKFCIKPSMTDFFVASQQEAEGWICYYSRAVPSRLLPKCTYISCWSWLGTWAGLGGRQKNCGKVVSQDLLVVAQDFSSSSYSCCTSKMSTQILRQRWSCPPPPSYPIFPFPPPPLLPLLLLFLLLLFLLLFLLLLLLHFNDERCNLASEMVLLQAPAFFLWQWLPLKTGFAKAWSRVNRIIRTKPWVHMY